MAKLIAGGDDTADRFVEADLAAVNNATPDGFRPVGRFNVTIFGVFVGTAVLERRFNAVDWVPCGNLGTPVAYTQPVSEQLTHSGEAGVEYRVRFAARTSGTVRVRLSQ